MNKQTQLGSQVRLSPRVPKEPGVLLDSEVAKDQCRGEKTHWWSGRPLRLIQTNLREIDTTFDIPHYIESLQSFHAEVVILNTGGIVANYPTTVTGHYRNPHASESFFAEAVAACRAAGIRVVSRFDFSKVDESIGIAHPEWLYVSPAGTHVNYHGVMHACVNSYYQQELALRIISEVLTHYPVDGIFFNMPGFITADYSGVQYGICQCENCRRAFLERFGRPLPTIEDPGDPDFLLYERFKRETVKTLLARISSLVKGLNPEIAIINYENDGVDIFRDESNSGIDRTGAEWTLSATQQVRRVRDTWPGMQISNSAVHFIDFPFRHAAVSPWLTARRLVQSMVNGGWLDFYVIGTLEQQDDSLCFGEVRRIFSFHAHHAEQYQDLRNLAKVAVVEPDTRNRGADVQEFRGCVRMLTELHIPYAVLHERLFSSPMESWHLERFTTIIFPGTVFSDPSVWEHIEQITCSVGCRLVLSGYAVAGIYPPQQDRAATTDQTGSPEMSPVMAGMGLASPLRLLRRSRAQSRYFQVDDPSRKFLAYPPEIRLVYCDRDIWLCEPAAETQSLLPLSDPYTFGPPEKCYSTGRSALPGTSGQMGDHDDPGSYGLYRKTAGLGEIITIPWRIGSQYETFANHAHRALIAGLLQEERRAVSLQAPACVEVSMHRNDQQGCVVISLVNHSGQLGTAFDEPLPLHGISLSMPLHGQNIREIQPLNSASDHVRWSVDDAGTLHLTLERLDLFETLLIRLS